MEKKKVITRENKWERSHFDVLGLCCSSEIPLIENILKPLQGIKEISVIIPTRTLIVVHDSLLISQIQIVKALNEARLEANVRVNGKGIKKKKWPNAWTIASGILLTASFLKYLYHPLRWLAVGAVAVAVSPILLKAFSSIRHLRIDVNILAIISVVGTIAMNDYTEAGSIVFLFSIAEWLESRASHKANVAMSTLMSLAPQKAVIEETGEMVEVNQVKLKTLLAVKAGEVIPIDGIVMEGKCEVDEKTLTGETFPVAKQKDSLVWAGTINLNGYISVQTSVVAEDCVVAKMAKLVEDAQNNKSKTQRFIDRCAKYYTPAVLVISACFAAIPAALRVDNLKHWFHLALVVLVSACPCALILSTPVATFCALTKAAMSGLLIKGGDHLEVLAKIKVMAFDKTGTITSGEFVVTDFRALQDDISLDTLLSWVSSIESKSSHPMAAALVSHGKLHSIDIKPENVEEFENFPGEGIHGKIDGNHIYIGSRKIAARAGCLTAPRIDNETKQGWTIGYVFCGAILAGTFSLSDTCRSGVKEAIDELKKLGIKTVMLTGDCRAAAMYAQQQLGNALDIVHSELLPEEKANLIKGFKKDGPTAMVGDGLNDTPALATADIGISMGVSGSALATETGNVILMSNDMRKIPKAIKLAKQSQMKVIQNVILSIGTKTAILGLAFAGHPLVWAAVLADVGTCLLVILNSMLLLRGTNKHRRKCRDKSSEPCQKKHGSNLGNGPLSHHHAHHDHKHCCSEEKAHKAQSMEPSNSNSCKKNRCPDSKSQVQCANNGDRGDHQCRKIQSHSPSEHCHTSLCRDHDHKHCSEEKAHKTQSMESSNSNSCKKNRCLDSESQVQCAKNGDCGDHQCRKIRCQSPSEHCHTSPCRDSERLKGNCEETNELHEEKHELFQIEKEEINSNSSNCKCNSHHIAIDIHESIDCERKEHKIGK